MAVKNTFINTLDRIRYIDPDTDYNGYCDVTKENDRRKAMSSYLINMMVNNLLSDSDIIDILHLLQSRISVSIDEENKLYLVEELTELLYIYTTSSAATLNKHEAWANIISFIETCSKYKAKDHPSISSRVIFKYMDILDYLKK